VNCGCVPLLHLFGGVLVHEVFQPDAGGGDVVRGAAGEVAGVRQLHDIPGGDGGLPGGHAGAVLPGELLPLNVLQHGLIIEAASIGVVVIDSTHGPGPAFGIRDTEISKADNHLH